MNNSVTSYRYFDGLGRPLQNIQVGVTPGQYYLVDYQEYDALGHESFSRLPMSLTATNNGKPIALNTVQSCSALYSDSKAYSKPVYENSPLNRISERYGPGQNCQNNGKSVKTEYLANSAGGELACRWYRTTDTRDDTQVSILSGSVNYPAGELYVTRTADEDGKGVKLFSYDELNRLSNAAYGETATISTNPDCFTEKITGYDKNGNITALQRYGQTTATAYGLIDNLSFTLNGNQLNRVDDAISASEYNNSFEFKDGVKQANEYAYDLNGNLTKV